MHNVTFVDIGSGYGSLLTLLPSIFDAPIGAPSAVRPGLYVPVDKSPRHLRAAVRRSGDLGIPAKPFLYDVDSGRGTIPDAAIGDFVVLAYVLAHVRSVESVLQLAARVAKSDSVITIVDTDYASAVADGDEALIRTTAAIRRQLRHTGFADLDAQAASVGLRRTSGLFDGVEHFGPRERSAKRDAFGFIANFDESNAARAAWEEIRGGTLKLRQIRRAYVNSDE